ncbi:EF-Hand 1, calcium-binding site-containing protein [Artemisia annua]|uniref:EF-Hand 1, calcium-binding site-containing protein n=1 Tax=Artemisia annua TaxID=35608 RepID=A0A2U1KTA2_ARTAN|nr:EF-Hand 1, calcium-binding site-containing protein [Artemisia annua]
MAGRINIISNKVDVEDVDGDGIRVAPNAGTFQSSTTNTTNDHVVTTDSVSPTGPNSQVNSIKSKHDFIEGVFGVSLKSASDIDLFIRELEEGKHPIWPTLDSATRSQGRVLAGRSVVDESMLTGKSLPAFKEGGLSVSARTINWGLSNVAKELGVIVGLKHKKKMFPIPELRVTTAATFSGLSAPSDLLETTGGLSDNIEFVNEAAVVKSVKVVAESLAIRRCQRNSRGR